jgi:hypothetical protein
VQDLGSIPSNVKIYIYSAIRLIMIKNQQIALSDYMPVILATQKEESGKSRAAFNLNKVVGDSI